MILNIEIKPLIYATSANAKTNVVYPPIDFVELNKVKKFLNEATKYKQCKNKKGDNASFSSNSS